MVNKRMVLIGPIVGAVMLTTSLTASAAPGGTPESFETSRAGAGSATTDTASDSATGALSARSAAVGGNGLRLPLFPGLLPGTGPATAGATAGVNQSVPVQAGTYEVTFTYRNADADISVRGGVADANTMSVATYTSADEVNKTPIPNVRFGDVPDDPTTVTQTIIVDVPEAGSLFVAGRVTATATADRRGNSATAAATVDATSIDVRRTS